MNDFLARLSSRKFLLVAATIGLISAGLLTPDELDKVITVVIAFIGAEGLADTAERFQKEKTQQTKNVLEDTKLQFGVMDDAQTGVDRGSVVAGNDIPMQ